MDLQPIYSDIDRVNPKTGLYIYNLDSIGRSIATILSIEKGTVQFKRDFGSNINGLLFEQLTPFTIFRIFNEITTSISKWETRVKLDQSKTKVYADPAQSLVVADLVFRIVGFGDRLFRMSFELPKLYKD